MKSKGIVYTVLSALLFGFTPVLASLTYSMGSNAHTLTFYRNLLVIPVLLVVMLVRKTSFRLTARELVSILIVGILGRGITTLSLYAAYDYVGIGTATTLHFLYPVFVALICRIFFREKLGWTKATALVLSSIGIVLFLDTKGSASLPGILLAAGSGLTYAFYMAGMEKTGLQNMDPFKLSFYMAGAVSLGMLAYNIPTQKIVFALPPKAFLYTFLIAICTSFFAVALLQLGIKYLSATTAAIFCLFEPVASSLSGVLFLSEELSGYKIMGSILILAAAVLLTLSGRLIRAKKNPMSVSGEEPDSVLMRDE